MSWATAGLRPSLGRLSSSWYSIPTAYRRLFLFVAVAALAPWLTVTSFDVRSYVIGAEQVLAGQSVYGPRIQSPMTGEVVPRYVYLPSYAVLVALGIAPFAFLEQAGLLPGVAYEVVARQVANAPGYVALVGLPVLAYRVCAASWGTNRFPSERSSDWTFWGVLLVTLTPALWFQVLESGSDSFVALLVVLGAYAVSRERWMTAGVLVGAATFKFTALPMAAVLALYALTRGREQFTAVAAGGLASQLPNVLYFAVFFEDLLFVLENRGTMSLMSGETRSVATAPVRLAGLEQWYIEVGFVVVFVVLVGLGTAVALRRGNLLLGFAVAYLSASYFAPVGEVNPSVLVVLLLFEAAVNLRRRPVRYLAAGLFTVQLYGFLYPFRRITHVSAVPFPWWSTVLQVAQFAAICIAMVGLTYYSDHGIFRE